MNIYALIGDPVEQSVSPEMQNAAFKEKEISGVYCKLRVSVEELAETVEGMRLMVSGFNVTIPHKETIIEHLDWVDKDASKIGAVNVVKNEANRLMGYNTDGKGAVAALKRIEELKDKNALVLGAGGAARSICYELCREGVEHLYIANRTKERAVKLCSDLRKNGCHCTVLALKDRELKEVIHNVRFLVNTTSVGMHPKSEASPIKREILHKDLIIEDIVYNPLETRLLREAESVGAKTINGVEMLVLQGAYAFEIWTGVEAPVEVMRDSAYNALLEFNKKEKK